MKRKVVYWVEDTMVCPQKDFFIVENALRTLDLEIISVTTKGDYEKLITSPEAGCYVLLGTHLGFMDEVVSQADVDALRQKGIPVFLLYGVFPNFWEFECHGSFPKELLKNEELFFGHLKTFFEKKGEKKWLKKSFL